MTLDRIAEASAVRPSPRQRAWQALEFYGFIHFGVNTMTDREWGLGHEDPKIFDPARLDADQWVDSLKSAGMTGLILTAKHHDGFCLWQSAATTHSVASSPWRGGRGDLVRDVAEACARGGIKLGIYLSPWDRTEPSYGTGTPYDDFFVAQLTELLTDYGDVFTVWFDGANGEGKNGKKQYYDWERYFALVRQLQPDAVINVCGPDVRWCGNEAGHTRKNEWSVVPASLRDAERTASISQQVDDGKFSRQVRSDEEDLGSRAAILTSEEKLVWYPAEVNTSIRPGWFHHPAEDDKVRSAEELFEIYRGSVGGNATFLLNLPPDRDGLIGAPDRVELARLGAMIAGIAGRDVARAARLSVSSGTLLPDGRWHPGIEDAAPTLKLTWSEPVLVDEVIIGEDIAHGQQVDALTVSGAAPGEAAPRTLVEIGAIGYRRMARFDPVRLETLVIRVDEARGPVHLTRLSVLRPA